MTKVKAVLEMSKDAYLALSSNGYTKERISLEAKRLLAADFFRRGILSLGKAAELADLNLGSFINLLDASNIPVVDYNDEELDYEFETAKELVENP